jgi:PKD repeat protein
MIDRATRSLILVLAVFAISLSARGNPVLSVPGEPAPVVTKDAKLLDLRTSDYPDTAVAEVRFPEIAPQRLELMRERNSSGGAQPLQIGVDRLVADEATEKALPRLHWVALATGGWVSRFAATSPGAAALRIEMKFTDLPESAEMRFLGTGQSRSVVDPVTGIEVNGHSTNSSTYWSPVTVGDRQMVEIYIARGGESAQVLVSVIGVAHLDVSPYGSLSGLKIGESGFCQRDVNCVSNPSAALLLAKSAVARMLFQKDGATFTCTGTLLNDTVSGSVIPYFFSANHCIGTQDAASTLVTLWFEESTSCGSGVPSPRVQLAGGATLLVADAVTDSLLLRLNNAPPSGAGLSGWDANPIPSGLTVGTIHHPMGDVKKISQGVTFGFAPFNGQGSYVEMGYLSGTVETGSSGGGLFLAESGGYALVGGLKGGTANCSNSGVLSDPNNAGLYSRLDLAYPALQPFLAPTQSQSQQLMVAKTGAGSGTVTSNPTGINCGVACSASFASGTQVTLSALAGAGSSFSGWSGCDSVASATCTVTLNATRNVTASFAVSSGGGSLDEPSASRVTLPAPNPPNASCPAGFFIATVGDGPGSGLASGAFGMELLLDDPGTRVLAGGLNFGGLIDAGQVGFAAFNIANPANEAQRVNVSLTGSPSTSSTASIPVRIRISRRTATTTDTVYESVQTISLASAFTTSIDLPPAFYEATVAPTSGVAGGTPEGQFFFSLTTSFVNRPGGGFQGGVVVGGYHATHPFGGVSGFAAFCLATPHTASMRVLSAPSYGAAGARDLRLQILDAQQATIIAVPSSAGVGNVAPTANFSFSTSSLTANFTDTSTDTDGTIAARNWSFGDGSTSTATNPSRTYAAVGTYTVALTVTDNGGATSSTSRAVTVTSGGGGAVQLSNNVAVNGSTNSTSPNSSFADYTVIIPAGASNLSVATTNATGDLDLHVRFGQMPTLTTYDCRPFLTGGNESCTFPTPSAGTYFVRVYGFDTGQQTFTIRATWTTGGGTPQLTCADLDGAYVLAQDPSATYLGFFGSRFASESIMNQFGTYGSEFSSTSVRNQFGTFGNSTGTYSAQNNFASLPPRIRKNGAFLAYLSTNSLQSPRVTLASIDANCSFNSSSPLRP